MGFGHEKSLRFLTVSVTGESMMEHPAHDPQSGPPRVMVMSQQTEIEGPWKSHRYSGNALNN